DPENADLYVSRARVSGRLGRTEEGRADLNRAAGLGADGEMLVSLADEYAKWGRLSQASALYAKARQRGPVPLPAWGRNALVRLGEGDHTSDRAHCRGLLDAHAKVKTPQEAEFIAKICALGPDATEDLHRAVDLAEFAVKRAAPFERPNFLCTSGAI